MQLMQASRASSTRVAAPLYPLRIVLALPCRNEDGPACNVPITHQLTFKCSTCTVGMPAFPPPSHSVYTSTL